MKWLTSGIGLFTAKVCCVNFFKTKNLLDLSSGNSIFLEELASANENSHVKAQFGLDDGSSNVTPISQLFEVLRARFWGAPGTKESKQMLMIGEQN